MVAPDSGQWTQCHGVLSSESEAPVNEASCFDVASLTKPVAATLIMKLREEGVIDIDKPLLEYARYEDVADLPKANAVTARHVMSHRSGLPNWRKLGEDLAFIAEPGVDHGYSGEGFIWLQFTIETITGRSFQDLLQTKVLNPLGMSRSSLGYDLARLGSENHADAHDDKGKRLSPGKVKQVAEIFAEAGVPRSATYAQALNAIKTSAALQEYIDVHPTNTFATTSGSLIASASDYARFMTLFLEGGNSAVLGRESVAEMLTPQVQTSEFTYAGLGWGLEHTPSALAFSHGGYNRGYLSYSLGRPDTGQAAVLLTNSDAGKVLRSPVITGATGAGHADIMS
ncbi:MAG: beta-lactamase family protein [Erythrobacter sp.]|nr:beta-lactamase family protein [Erythrobacter sp.]